MKSGFLGSGSELFLADRQGEDSLNDSFVIVEYKKGSSYSVIDQGYSYLSTMLNNKSDFVLELIENSDLNHPY